MNDSEYFQDVESNYSGRLSQVSSQLAMIPSSCSLLSRDKRLPLDTWNQSGVQENVFGNQFSTLNSPRDHSQIIQSDDVQRHQETVPEAARTKTTHTSEDRLNHGTIPNADVCNKAVDYEFYKSRWDYRRPTWLDSKDSVFSELLLGTLHQLLITRFWCW